MRAVVQRVTAARVAVEGEIKGAINVGLVVFAALGADDTVDDLRWMADKVVSLRIFHDDQGRFDRSVLDVGGALLAISQFTLYGDCRKGRRPSFTGAAPPAAARELFPQFLDLLRATGAPVETGEFGAMMTVEVTNDGPVTLLLDSRKQF
jgi:D-tyrosyl-tRNA(Tyr) deacylase